MKTLFPFKKNSAVVFFVFIFIFLSLVVLSSFAWHSFAIKNPQIAVYLDEYDTIVSSKDPCFRMNFDYSNTEEDEDQLFITLNEKIIDSVNVTIGKDESFDYCVSNSLLSKGDNLVGINVYSRDLFFHVKKTDEINSVSPELKVYLVSKHDDSSADVSFLVKNSFGVEKKVNIFVNGVLVKSSFFNDGINNENIPITSEKNTIRLEYSSLSSEKDYSHSFEQRSNVIFGLILVSFFFFISSCFVFSNKPFVQNISLSILSLFVSLALIFFFLNYLSLLSSVSFIASFILLCLALVIIFRDNFSVPKISFPKLNHFSAYIAVLILLILFFNLLTPTFVSFWTVFYERQSRDIFENNGVPLKDMYTHFGSKPYGYMSAYFFVDAGLSYIFGEPSKTVYALILVLANIAFIFSGYLFFRKMGLSDKKSILGLMLALLAGFLFGDIFFNVRHLIAVGLVFSSLYLLLEKRMIKASFLLGAAMFFQAPVILTGAIVAFVLVKEKLVSLVKYLLLAGVIGLLFYIPTFVLVGLPSQAQPTTWGYLFGMPWYGVAVDLLAQLIFFFLILLPLSKGKLKTDKFSKKVLLAVAVLIFVQLFVSYRVNIATTIIFSFICVYFFPENLLDKKEIRHLLLLIFMGGLIVASTVLLNYVVPDFAISSAEYMRDSTPSEARVLNEPALGHYLAYFGEKKIMSDLAVEYANGSLIDQSFSFLTQKDPSVISRNKIDYVFNRAMYIEIQPVGSPGLKEKIEFDFLDKIYDNGVFFVHKVN